MSQAPHTLIPVTILTGFLGSGKTTLLNRILKENHGLKIAVIENEFGEEGVDNDLLLQNEQENIVEMNNGCLCCTVRGDLVRILGDMAARKKKGEIKFDRVVIETTGMADPGPVAQTFFVDDVVAESYLLDAVITVVDAKHGMQQLDEHREIQQQVGFADRILLSKTDLASTDEVQTLKKRLAKMNARAEQMISDHGNAPVAKLLDVKGFNLNSILDIAPDFLDEDKHTHNDEIQSFVFKSTKPFDGQKFEEFMGSVTQVYGPDMLRYKGILSIKGSDRRALFQGVHMLMGLDWGRKWEPADKKESKIVFIGRKLPKEFITQGLELCLAR
ncbi:MAG TPA: GTP-binding protein [Limnobacter sp.]|uniref:CobW family GTP-binding protein n=1 Tax=Limnobacter sp. TaxID=2003368 RepID=UPI002ED813ED